MDKQFKIWDGVFGSFAEAHADEATFDGDVWLDKARATAHEAIAASQGETEVPSIAETTNYALPFVAATVARRDRTLRILDFGGGMAASYFSLVAMLPPDQPLDYVIVENDGVCREGDKLLATDHRISFRTDLPEPGTCYDIVHCGSSLHYVDDWRQMLGQLAAYRPAHLLFADLPAADNCSFVTAQAYYGRRIAVHFWNLREFILAVQDIGYDLLLKARYRGRFLGPAAAMPTEHFDCAHRLTYCSQLIFRRAAGC
ncbi:MAG: methyltransferase, TIGR04325 family [Xanthobacteraceae bacterium]